MRVRSHADAESGSLLNQARPRYGGSFRAQGFFLGFCGKPFQLRQVPRATGGSIWTQLEPAHRLFIHPSCEHVGHSCGFRARPVPRRSTRPQRVGPFSDLRDVPSVPPQPNQGRSRALSPTSTDFRELLETAQNVRKSAHAEATRGHSESFGIGRAPLRHDVAERACAKRQILKATY